MGGPLWLRPEDPVSSGAATWWGRHVRAVRSTLGGIMPRIMAPPTVIPALAAPIRVVAALIRSRPPMQILPPRIAPASGPRERPPVNTIPPHWHTTKLQVGGRGNTRLSPINENPKRTVHGLREENEAKGTNPNRATNAPLEVS